MCAVSAACCGSMRGSTDRSDGLANSNVYLGRYQYSESKGRCEALLAGADSGGCGGGPVRLGTHWPHKTVALRRELFTWFSRAGLCGLLDLAKAERPARENQDRSLWAT